MNACCGHVTGLRPKRRLFSTRKSRSRSRRRLHFSLVATNISRQSGVKKKNWKLKCRETRNSSSQYGVNRNRSTLPFSFFSCTRVTLLALLSLLTLLHNTCKPKPKRSGVSFLFFLYFTYFNHTTTLVNRNRSALPLLSSPPLFYLLEPHKTGKPQPKRSAVSFRIGNEKVGMPMLANTLCLVLLAN